MLVINMYVLLLFFAQHIYIYIHTHAQKIQKYLKCGAMTTIRPYMCEKVVPAVVA